MFVFVCLELARPSRRPAPGLRLRLHRRALRHRERRFGALVLARERGLGLAASRLYRAPPQARLRYLATLERSTIERSASPVERRPEKCCVGCSETTTGSPGWGSASPACATCIVQGVYWAACSSCFTCAVLRIHQMIVIIF